MFDIGFAEALLIGVVAILVFGPDRLPEFARQAGRFLRQVKTMADGARDDIRNELGPEFSDLELADLDPRRIVRKHVMEAMADEGGTRNPRQGPALREGEVPPWDVDAT